MLVCASASEPPPVAAFDTVGSGPYVPSDVSDDAADAGDVAVWVAEVTPDEPTTDATDTVTDRIDESTADVDASPADVASDAPVDVIADASRDATTDVGPSPPARYLALGDSYTLGESVAVAERWPVLLVEALRTEGVSFAEEAPEIIARTGWTTAQLDAAIDEAEPEGPYQLVSLLIGVNNQFQRRSIDEFRDEFGVLLGRAIAFADGDPARVLVLSIPDWGVTPFARRFGPVRIAREIDQFNAVKREICDANEVAFVDITPISRRIPDEPELIAEDGLHPSGAMYAEWVVEALPFARENLAMPISE